MSQFDHYCYEVDKDMDREKFFERFPKRPADANKGSFGKILLISGSFGMAGAACLNIIGAKALGASYINVALPEDIYGIVASVHITPVYYPFNVRPEDHDTPFADDVVSGLLPGMKAVCFGSGAVNSKANKSIFKALIKDCTSPLVLDAQALKLIRLTGTAMDQFGCPVILTPHQGEFCVLADMSLADVKEDPVRCAADYAARNNVIMVLKGPQTVVAAPDGRYYINRSGNQGLAQAGSGDVLAGMMTAMLSFIQDPFEAACMAVFAHGTAADELAKDHSLQCLPIEEMPVVMDRLFKEHGL